MSQEIVKQSVDQTEGTRPGRSYRPNADIGEKADGVWLAVDVPGVDQDSVEVELNDGVLTIEGRVALDAYDELSPVYSEYNVGNFERRFRVSNRVDPKGIQARIEHGVLHLFLPKPEEQRPRTIAVKAG
jgi:HSP20 family molecular chaperone IbpA